MDGDEDDTQIMDGTGDELEDLGLDEGAGETVSDADQEAAFMDGYENGAADPVDLSAPIEDEPAEAPASAATAGEGDAEGGAAAAPGSEGGEIDWEQRFKDLEGRVRKGEGQMGAIYDAALNQEGGAAAAPAAPGAPAAPADGAQPTEADLTAALGSSEAFQKFQTNFPDIAGPVLDELKTAFAQLSTAAPVDIDAIKAEAAQAARNVYVEEGMADRHGEDWVERINSEPFTAWIDVQDDEIKRQFNSDKMKDASAMMDEYAKFEAFIAGQGEDGEKFTSTALLAQFNGLEVDSTSQQVSEDETGKQNAQNRLRSSIPATGGAGGSRQTTVKTEDEIFEESFKKTRGG